jgi:hypothetical protein
MFYFSLNFSYGILIDTVDYYSLAIIGISNTLSLGFSINLIGLFSDLISIR